MSCSGSISSTPGSRPKTDSRDVAVYRQSCAGWRSTLRGRRLVDVRFRRERQHRDRLRRRPVPRMRAPSQSGVRPRCPQPRRHVRGLWPEGTASAAGAGRRPACRRLPHHLDLSAGGPRQRAVRRRRPATSPPAKINPASPASPGASNSTAFDRHGQANSNAIGKSAGPGLLLRTATIVIRISSDKTSRSALQRGYRRFVGATSSHKHTIPSNCDSEQGEN